MHLIYIFTFDYSLSTWDKSGHISRESKYFSELSKNVYNKITLVTYGDITDYEYIDSFKNIEIFPIYNFTKKPKRKFTRYLKSFYFPFLIYKNLELKENSILKQNQLLGSWVSIGLKLISKCKLVTRTGYDMFTFSKYDKKNILLRIAYFVLTQFTLLFSDAYTVTSNVDKSFIKKIFFFTKKISLIPNWVITDNFKKNINRNKNTILSIGRIEKQKNLFQLIDEIKNSGFKLLHIGTGSLSKEFVNYADKNSVSLSIIEKVDNKEVYKFLNKYLFFISFSKYEGNSKTILEAMSSGCVVLASDIPNNDELIINNEDGILLDLNSPNLTLKLNALMGNEELVSLISNNAKNRINLNNSLRRIIDLESDLIHKIIQ